MPWNDRSMGGHDRTEHALHITAPRIKPRSEPRIRPHGPPRGSPRRSPRGSPRGSPRRSPRRSPRGSPRRSPRGSPRGKPRSVTSQLNIIGQKLGNLYQRTVHRPTPWVADSSVGKAGASGGSGRIREGASWRSSGRVGSAIRSCTRSGFGEAVEVESIEFPSRNCGSSEGGTSDGVHVAVSAVCSSGSCVRESAATSGRGDIWIAAIPNVSACAVPRKCPSTRYSRSRCQGRAEESVHSVLKGWRRVLEQYGEARVLR